MKIACLHRSSFSVRDTRLSHRGLAGRAAVTSSAKRRLSNTYNALGLCDDLPSEWKRTAVMSDLLMWPGRNLLRVVPDRRDGDRDRALTLRRLPVNDLDELVDLQADGGLARFMGPSDRHDTQWLDGSSRTGRSGDTTDCDHGPEHRAFARADGDQAPAAIPRETELVWTLRREKTLTISDQVLGQDGHTWYTLTGLTFTAFDAIPR